MEEGTTVFDHEAATLLGHFTIHLSEYFPSLPALPTPDQLNQVFSLEQELVSPRSCLAKGD